MDKIRCQQQQSISELAEQYPAASLNNSGISNFLAINTSWSNEIELVPVSEASLLSPDHVDCLLAQAFNLTVPAGTKPFDLEGNFIGLIEGIKNNTTVQHVHSPAQASVMASHAPATQQHLIAAYLSKMRQIYEDSSQVFLNSQQLREHSERFVNDLECTTVSASISTFLSPYCDQLREFHENIQASMGDLNAQVNQKVEEILSRHESEFVAELERKEGVLQEAGKFRKYDSLRNYVGPMAQEVTTQVLTSLPYLRSMSLPAGTTEIFSSKLKAAIGAELVSQFTSLENQMELCHEAVASFKNVLSQIIRSSVCLSQEQFDQEVQRVRASIQTETLVRPALKHSLDKIMKTQEDQLRQLDTPLMTHRPTSSNAVPTTAAIVPYVRPPAMSSTPAPCNIGIYFGSEIVVFMPCNPNGSQRPAVQSLKPLATYWNGKMFWGTEAQSVSTGHGGHHFNVFAILTTRTVVAFSEQSSDTVAQINGESVILTPEAMAVLFFREGIRRLSLEAGTQIRSCTVAVPGLLPRGAMSVIKEAVILAGIPEVTFVPAGTAIAMALVQFLPNASIGTVVRPKKIVTVYHAGPFLEVALLKSSPGQLETRELVGFLDLPAQRQTELASLLKRLLEKVLSNDLLAIVMMVEREGNPHVTEAINKKIKH